MNRKLLLFLLSLCFSSFAIAQGGENFLRSLFFQKVALENSILVNGIEPVDTKIIGNYSSGKFLNSEFEAGSITYNNHYFQNIQLKYNVYDDFVLANISQNQIEKTFQLIKGELTKFSIGNKNFEWLEYEDNAYGYLEIVFK